MTTHALDSSSDRLVRGGALAAVLTLALALLSLGLYFYRPASAAAQPAFQTDNPSSMVDRTVPEVQR